MKPVSILAYHCGNIGEEAIWYNHYIYFVVNINRQIATHELRTEIRRVYSAND